MHEMHNIMCMLTLIVAFCATICERTLPSFYHTNIIANIIAHKIISRPHIAQICTLFYRKGLLKIFYSLNSGFKLWSNFVG